MIEISIGGFTGGVEAEGGCLCACVRVCFFFFLHDEMDCLQVHSAEENLEVKEEI